MKRRASINVRTWARRNVWPLQSGELAVRPGLREVYTAESGRVVVAGFSVRNPFSGDVWHYVVDVASSGAADTKIRIYDEDFQAIQVYDTSADVRPRAVTHAVVQDHIIITSPDFPTVWGVIGSGITTAEKVDSVNTTRTTLDVPQGLCVSWADRCVIADGSSIFFSDAVTLSVGDPRAFIGDNQVSRPGVIYGLHVGAGGSLVVVASDGVWALPEDAAGAGQVVFGLWQRLTDHQASGFMQSCAVRGRIYGLTRRGYRLIDTQGTDEVLLDDPVMPRAIVGRIATEDYRAAGRMLASDLGPIVSLDDLDTFHMHDLATGATSWWEMLVTGEEGHVVGVLEENDGDVMLLTEKGGYRLFGNFDGDATSEDGTVAGVLAGVIPTPPGLSPVLRAVDWASDTQGDIEVSVRGTTKTKAPPQVGVVEGSSTWNGSDLWETPPLRSRRTRWSVRRDDLAVELSADNCLQRLGDTVDIEFAGPGARRASS